LIIPKKDAVEPRGIRLSDHHATIIVVEDDPDLADLYAAWLDDRYDVHVARGGEEALSVVNRGVDARVVMVTAVDPDFDNVVRGFNDYLVKPVSCGRWRRPCRNCSSGTSTQQTFRDCSCLRRKRPCLRLRNPRRNWSRVRSTQNSRSKPRTTATTPTRRLTA
jgi:DNA-binding response OmpR family regulator